MIKIKVQREKFRKFAKDSIKFSDNLADYSIDTMLIVVIKNYELIFLHYFSKNIY